MVVVGDSNIVGTPLSVLLRDAGAGTVTVCHRIAYTNIFEDRIAAGRVRKLRTLAHACLPRLPGPYPSAENVDASLNGAESDYRAAQPGHHCEPPDAARVTVVQKANATEIVVEVRFNMQ